jgi:hypothetical protein
MPYIVTLVVRMTPQRLIYILNPYTLSMPYAIHSYTHILTYKTHNTY